MAYTLTALSLNDLLMCLVFRAPELPQPRYDSLWLVDRPIHRI